MNEVNSDQKSFQDENIRLVGVPSSKVGQLAIEDQMPRYFDEPPVPARIPPRSRAELMSGKLEGVFEPDSRLMVSQPEKYPYSAICALTMLNKKGKKYYGTGFMIGPRLILTAAHNVYYHQDGGFMKQIQVYPGLNGNRHQTNLPTAISSNFSTVEAWVNDASIYYDFGAIFLDKDLSNATGTLSVSKFRTVDLQAMTVTVSGYPRDPPRESNLPPDGTRQWRAAGRVAPESHVLRYSIDTSIGQSGSPIIAYFSGSNEYHAIGVHTMEDISGNAGTRFTDEVFSQILKWRQRSDGQSS